MKGDINQIKLLSKYKKHSDLEQNLIGYKLSMQQLQYFAL